MSENAFVHGALLLFGLIGGWSLSEALQRTIRRTKSPAVPLMFGLFCAFAVTVIIAIQDLAA